jgi:hypothetical protein
MFYLFLFVPTFPKRTIKFLSHDIYVTLRTLCIVIYSILLIPVLNLYGLVLITIVGVVALVIILTPIAFLPGKDDLFDRDTTFLACCWVFAVGLDIVFVVNTELMIRHSAALVKPGASDWTFGQTLAMLTFAPHVGRE